MPTYYKIPTGYEHAVIYKRAKIGSEKSSELPSTDNEQGTCSQLWRFTGNPRKCNLVDNTAHYHEGMQLSGRATCQLG